MPALSRPDTITGPLTAADLDAARQHSTGRIVHLHRAAVMQCPPCTGDCRQGRDCHPQPTEACTELGAEVESMWRYRRTRSTVLLAVALAVAGYAAHLIWPLA